MTTNRDINTIPTTDRHIVSYKIQVEWSDNPKSVVLEHDMPSHVANAIDEWFGEIETEENV